MKKTDKFKVLKRSLESALSHLMNNGRASSKSSARQTREACDLQAPQAPSKFPDSQFVLCILLVAIKALQSRGHLHKLGLQNSAGAFQQAEKLFQIANNLCRSNIKIDTELIHNKGLEKALRELDVNPPEVLRDDLTLGYSYQFLSMAARKIAQAKVQTANKEHSTENLISFTQLYTPGWVVDYLVANSVLNSAPEELREHLGSTSGTTELPHSNEFKRWLPQQFAPKQNFPLRSLTIIDPACGAGNFLVRAADLLIQLHLASGCTRDQAVANTLQNNIFGVDIDPAAAWIAGLTLLVKGLSYSDKIPDVTLNIDLPVPSTLVAQQNLGEIPLLGSIDRNFSDKDILGQKYAVVLMNPPYIGRKLMSRELKLALKANYPKSHSDICTAFIERSLEMLESGGTLAVITQASMLTLPSYGELRRQILTRHNLRMCVDAGTNVFPLQGGDKVNSVMLVVQNTPASETDRSIFFDLRKSERKMDLLRDQLEKSQYYSHAQMVFLKERENAIKYACPQLILELCEQAVKLEDVAEVRQGLATTDNNRFIRLADDVPAEELGTKWFPYVKGAGSDRWFSEIKHVVNWQNDGQEIKEAVSTAYPYLNGNIKWVVKNEQFYFREGLCFSFVNTGRLAVRKMPAGCIFDVGASAVFANNQDNEFFLLAYLNSSLVGAIASAINPTINFQVGDIKCLPLFPMDENSRERLSELAFDCCILSGMITSSTSGLNGTNSSSGLSRLNETSSSSGLTALVPADPKVAENPQLKKLEKEIDEIVFTAFCTNHGLTIDQSTEISDWINKRNMVPSAQLIATR